MADLTIGEIGITLQEQLLSVDQTQSPPASTPLDLTNVSSVALSYYITAPGNSSPQPPVKTVPMGILGSPTNGVVFYVFAAGDLVKPANMVKDGVFRYTIKITFNNGNVFYPISDGVLTIKDDSIL
jgi:hypothetical protein